MQVEQDQKRAYVWTVGACQFNRQCSWPVSADLFLHGVFSFHRHTALGLSSLLGSQVSLGFFGVYSQSSETCCGFPDWETALLMVPFII